MTVDVEQLVHDHKKAISTVDGIEFHTQPGLLAQLREAVHGWVGGDAGGGPRAKLPIQAAALDLYMLVEGQIAEVWAAVSKKVPGLRTPESLLSEWAAWADDDTMVTVDGRTMYAVDAVSSWVRMIDDYFNPPRLAEIDAKCPACGDRYAYRVVDGETVRSAALSFRRDRDTGETLDARCGPCGTVWSPAQFQILARMIGQNERTTPHVEVVEEETTNM